MEAVNILRATRKEVHLVIRRRPDKVSTDTLLYSMFTSFLKTGAGNNMKSLEMLGLFSVNEVILVLFGNILV